MHAQVHCLLFCIYAEPEDILSHSPTAGLLRPAYVIFLDRASHKIILCVRGTHSRSDMFTSLTGGWMLSMTYPCSVACRHLHCLQSPRQHCCSTFKSLSQRCACG